MLPATSIPYAVRRILAAMYRIRYYKNLHIFLGPSIATDSLGVHLDIGFRDFYTSYEIVGANAQNGNYTRSRPPLSTCQYKHYV